MDHLSIIILSESNMFPASCFTRYCINWRALNPKVINLLRLTEHFSLKMAMHEQKVRSQEIENVITKLNPV